MATPPRTGASPRMPRSPDSRAGVVEKQPPRLHPHDGIGARVESLTTTEYCHPDEVLLETHRAVPQLLLDGKLKKAAQLLGAGENAALDDAMQLLVNRLRRGSP